ncbi:hypothetical protein MO973_32570 [Paenibacillus sp. TRM 82003]|uniref:hypothetical protein n=1 Tax=Kineococcus sp. TRM81007 TaxID=2925831 RepID=UPI001F561818|nr:hypothetical protein [Kineococcus sp. TRM81007]MCI2239271.1 hypothetical protein [Kineococcus sp. TRM81007]MCI3924953.1 hypothetical protein [Paenibacillus sp. TRM 82003]
MSEQNPERTRLKINWVQIAGGALAAATSAVLLAGLRSLGPLSTLLGAAVGSIAASTAAAVYNHYLTTSQERLAEAARRARERRQDPSPVPAPQDEHPERADAPPGGAGDPAPVPAPAPELVPAPVTARRFGARHAVLLGVLAFVISVGGIAVYEHVGGRSVAAQRQDVEEEVTTGVLGGSLTQAPRTPAPADTPTGPAASPTGTASTSPTATPTATASATRSPDASATGGTSTRGASPTATASSTASSTATATSDPDEPDGAADGAAAGSPGSSGSGEADVVTAPSPEAPAGPAEVVPTAP